MQNMSPAYTTTSCSTHNFGPTVSNTQEISLQIPRHFFETDHSQSSFSASSSSSGFDMDDDIDSDFEDWMSSVHYTLDAEASQTEPHQAILDYENLWFEPQQLGSRRNHSTISVNASNAHTNSPLTLSPTISPPRQQTFSPRSSSAPTLSPNSLENSSLHSPSTTPAAPQPVPQPLLITTGLSPSTPIHATSVNQSRYLRRREQNRRAQHKYRIKKEDEIITLKRQVADLRAELESLRVSSQREREGCEVFLRKSGEGVPIVHLGLKEPGLGSGVSRRYAMGMKDGFEQARGKIESDRLLKAKCRNIGSDNEGMRRKKADRESGSGSHSRREKEVEMWDGEQYWWAIASAAERSMRP